MRCNCCLLFAVLLHRLRCYYLPLLRCYCALSRQEALLHVYMGERAVSELLQQVAALHRRGAPVPGPSSPPPVAPQSDHEPPLPPDSAAPTPVAATADGRSSSSSSSSSTSSSDPPAVDLAQRASPPVALQANTSSTVRQCNGTDTLLRFRASLATLDRFSAEDVLAQPCCLFRVPPHFCKGVLRPCLRLAFDLVLCACDSSPAAHWSRAWKLLLFAPRMLLHRPRKGIRLEKAVLLARFQSFLRGEWAPLLDEALSQPLPQEP